MALVGSSPASWRMSQTSWYTHDPVVEGVGKLVPWPGMIPDRQPFRAASSRVSLTTMTRVSSNIPTITMAKKGLTMASSKAAMPCRFARRLEVVVVAFILGIAFYSIRMVNWAAMLFFRNTLVGNHETSLMGTIACTVTSVPDAVEVVRPGAVTSLTVTVTV